MFSLLIELLQHNRLVSSAKWWILQDFITWLRSFIYSKNRRGPRTDPWGTPKFIAARTYSYPFIDTSWWWLDRYDLNQSFETPQIPKWFNFANSIWWSTVSKAFCKSTKIPQPIFPSSRVCSLMHVHLLTKILMSYSIF